MYCDKSLWLVNHANLSICGNGHFEIFQLFVSLLPPLPIFLPYNKLPMTKKDLARKILRGQEITVSKKKRVWLVSLPNETVFSLPCWGLDQTICLTCIPRKCSKLYNLLVAFSDKSSQESKWWCWVRSCYTIKRLWWWGFCKKSWSERETLLFLHLPRYKVLPELPHILNLSPVIRVNRD